MELLFLSFTTLSSTGLSDITPISGHARSVVMLEQVAGVFYIAMVVTRLVALRGQRARPHRRERPSRMSTLELTPEPRSVRRRAHLGRRRAGRARPRRPGRRRRARGLRAGDQRDPARRPADLGPASGGTATHPRVEVHDTSLVPPRGAQHDRRRPAAGHDRPRPRDRRDVLHHLGRRGVPPGQGGLVRAGRRRRRPTTCRWRATCSTWPELVDERLADRRGARATGSRCGCSACPCRSSRTTGSGTRSSVASCGCSRSTTATTTRSPRALRAHPAGGAGAPAGQRRRPRSTPRSRAGAGPGRPRVPTSRPTRRPRWPGCSSCSSRSTSSAASSGCSPWRPSPQQLMLRSWYLGEFEPPGRGRGTADPVARGPTWSTTGR